MKREYQKRALFDAVTNIDEDLIAEAAAPKTLTFPKYLRRFAAVAAVIAILLTTLLWPVDENYVTGPGLFVVMAHAVDDTGNAIVESEALQVGMEFPPTIRYEVNSHREKCLFIFSVKEGSYPGMALSAEVKTNAGIFGGKPFDINEYLKFEQDDELVGYSDARQLVMGYYGQHFTVEMDKAIHWLAYGFDYDYMVQEIEKGNTDANTAYKLFNFENNPSFIDVIFRADDKIVGYCVIAIYETSTKEDYPVREFSFELLTMVGFPQVDGRYQSVSEAYVDEQIQKCHEKAEMGGDN